MEEILNQEQIGALLQKARTSTSAVKPAVKADGKDGGKDNEQEQKASSFDLRQSMQLSPSQTRSITAVQDSFARGFGDALSAYLRAGFEVKLASIEQIAYSEFMSRLPDLTYFASLRIPSLGACALLQADLALILQIVDMLLGGSGKDQTEARDLTEIEEDVFESVAQLLCRELKSAWRGVREIEFEFDERHKEARSVRLMPASEKVLSVTFDVTLMEAQSKFTVGFPSALSASLLREAAIEMPFSEPSNSQKDRARLQEALLNSRFDTELVLPPSPVSVREVFKLQPGSVLVLEVRATEPIHLNVAGKNMFLAAPVGCGSQRGAQVEKVLSIAPDKDGK
jgi:flagellar motor switch protein FliM